MTTKRNYGQYWFNVVMFVASIPSLYAGLAMLVKETPKNFSGWTLCSLCIMAPFYFYNEIMTIDRGYTKVVVTTNKLFKCRVRGTDEVFYIKADTEEEAELFFDNMMEGKQVFIEEANIKLLGFDMNIPKDKHEA